MQLVANGENRMRNVLEIVRLPAMERDGWTGLSAAVGRIWAGSRDAAAVCVGLDKNTAFFVRKILEYVEMGKDRLAAISDSNVRSAMPVDAEFDLIAAQFRPYLDRCVLAASLCVRASACSAMPMGCGFDQIALQVRPYLDRCVCWRVCVGERACDILCRLVVIWSH